MKFKNAVEEKQYKICELHESLGCDYQDIEQIDNDTYIDTTTNKKYNVIVQKKKFIITELEG